MLFEDVGDDIKKAAKGGPASVRAFVDGYPDKKELKDALQGGYDNEKTDDEVDVSAGTPVEVDDLVPTQKEIDLMKSVAFPLGDYNSLRTMIATNTSTAKGFISISGNEVLDGHHRWSGVWGICGPKGTVPAQDIALPGGDTSQRLAAAQLAIAAYKPADAKQPSSSEPIEYNIMGEDGSLPKETIKKMIIDNTGNKTDPTAPGALFNDEMLEQSANDETIAKWAGFKVGDDVETVKERIADKVATNLSTLPANPNAPARADMPQFDHEIVGGKPGKAAIYAGLKAGEFNVNDPIKPTQKESRRREDRVIMERWLKLAGIVKG
jgi:hypothetical protein